MKHYVKTGLLWKWCPVSWSFVPSLIGCMLLMFGVVFTIENDASTGGVLLVLGALMMSIWLWMVKRGK